MGKQIWSIFFLAGFLLIISHVTAQDYKQNIRGVVKDAESLQAIPQGKCGHSGK